MNATPKAKSKRQESFAEKLLSYYLVALSVLLIIVSALYFDTFRSMVAIWLRSDTFLHGVIILPISSYLVWRKWPQLKSIPARPSIPGLFLLLGASIAWFFADALSIQVGEQLAATAIIPSAILTVMGVSFVRVIAFPLGYLFFAVPFGEFWVPELQAITAEFAIGLLRLTGIPVFRDGLFLSIPSGNFEVAEACSGIRYLLATLALGTLYAYLNYHKTYKRLIFIGFSFLLPIVANGIRAYGIIAIAHYSDMKHAVGVDHLIYGWVFFGVVIGLMFLVGSYYRDDNPSDRELGSIDAREAQPVPTGSRLTVVVLSAVAVVSVGPLAGHAAASSLAQESELLNGLPNSLSGWQGTVLPDTDWAPSFIGATQETLVRYQGSEAPVDVALIRYARQRQGSELANSSNSIYGGNGWRRHNTRRLSVELVDGGSLLIFETSAVRYSVTRRFWYWYEVGGNPVASSLKIKLYEAVGLVMGRPAISSAIIVSVIEDGSGPDVLQTFMNDAYAAIRVCLGETAPQKDCQLGSPPMSSEINPKTH